jgi:uncharacterized membrane protein YedE/YeeE
MILSPSFDWQSAAVGGVAIAVAAILMLVFLGRIMGVSGIFAEAIQPASRPFGPRWVFVGALLLGTFVSVDVFKLEPFGTARPQELSTAAVLLSGVLVGFGTQLGHGCTSGHGVCGIARLSVRSLTSVATFLITAMVTATFVHSHPSVFPHAHVSSLQSLYHIVVPGATTVVVLSALLLILLGTWGTYAEKSVASPMAEVLVTFLAGSLFAWGLCVGKMTDLHKVQEFLILTPIFFSGAWLVCSQVFHGRALRELIVVFVIACSNFAHGVLKSTCFMSLRSFSMTTPITHTSAGSLTVPDSSLTTSVASLWSRSNHSLVSNGWDPSLMCILGVVIPINLVVFYFVLQRKTPVCSAAFPVRVARTPARICMHVYFLYVCVLSLR